MTTVRVAIIGAGTVGGIAAAMLSRLGHDVLLCVRRPLSGLIVEIDGDAHDVRARIATQPALASPVDWILLATKAQDTPSAAPWLDRLVGPNSVVVVLQNGIDHVERVGPLLRQGQVLPAVVYSSGEVVAPGHIRAAESHRYVVPAGTTGAAFAQIFADSRLKVEQSSDFVTAAWRKFLANICVNPITALTMCRIGIIRDAEIGRLARGILTEAVTVGRGVGACFEIDEVERMLDSFAAHDPDGGSSMLFDRLAGRPMEHEHLTGALVRTAARLGIDVPLNHALLALLRGLQTSQLMSTPTPPPRSSMSVAS